MAHTTEETWAKTLMEERQRSTKRTRVPLVLRKKQVEEDMAYYQKQIKTYADAGDAEHTKESLNALIRLRAKQFALIVEEEKEKQGGITDARLEEETQRYRADCADFMHRINIA